MPDHSLTNTPSGKRLSTRIVEAGRRQEWTGAVVNPPVWRASTHLYPDTAALRDANRRNEDGQFFYGRRGAPTQWALAEALTELEDGADGTVLYPSGVSAIAGALLAVLKAGDVCLMTDNAYDPSRSMGMGLLKDMGIETRFFDPHDHAAYEALFCDRTKAVLLEAPGSLTMEMQDVPALSAVARRHDAVTLVDNTWAGPTGFSPLTHGADITIMALTKHVGGHSDLLMGSASAKGVLYRKLRHRAQSLGVVVSPDDASLALRGLRTLDLRLKQTTSSAVRVARYLAANQDVAQVLCPMVEGAPGHDLWTRDFTGGCGLFSFVLRGGNAAYRDRLVDALKIFGIGFSWGGYESLALPIDPAPMRSVTPWPPAGWDPQDRFGVRLAIGLEDPDDLIADLDRAFSLIGHPA